ncbi:rho GTPase-activating protein 6 [Chanos chanos]|uniref:Rho GTPase-activating protein 6 n=1 Tax=Chanos chanos TaxID=29144 RepID=A0A6J2WF48_CHACN|nr:rho GTPase-activating protein 6-like [Chanos chanos]
MSAQGLLSSVFLCSSSGSKTVSKRKLRQTRSFDPALIRHCGTGSGGASAELNDHRSLSSSSSQTGGFSYFQTSTESLTLSRLEARSKTLRAKHLSSSSLSASSDTSPSSSDYFDYDVKSGKRHTTWDLSFTLRSHASSTTGSGTIFSPRKWLQKRPPQTDTLPNTVWKSEGDFTWKSTSGRSVRLQPVPIQSLSELERVRLQDVALSRLQQNYDLGSTITIPKDGQKRKKSLRRKFDSLSKEKSKVKECVPQAFGLSLSEVIANDRRHKQRVEDQRAEQRDPSDLMTSILHFASRRTNKELSSSNSSLSSTSETPNEPNSPDTPEVARRARRRGGMSVDCITDLDDSQSRLLEALQLSLPAETPSKKEKHRDKKLSLNPIYRQVPRVVDCCCQHLERNGLQTVGIFRVGSSKKRVRQLREEFDLGEEVVLDEKQSVHDVAALLKEFLRDMPDPLLTRELYSAFINCLSLDPAEQHSTLHLLISLLPPCNSDTLHCLLEFLSTVAAHAEDTYDKDGHEIPGNKMTSLNLATIFGPNLLHKQKSSDKEFSVQTPARVEDSAAIIGVVQRMIDTYDALFTVSADLQHEVLLSLLETDPDVVDYLLRRKASQWESPSLSRTDDSLSLSGRRSSTDSMRASSGEVSPYDNNSPVGQSDWLLPPGHGDDELPHSPEKLTHTGQAKAKAWVSSSTPPQTDSDEKADEKSRIWTAWHASLKSEHQEPQSTDSLEKLVGHGSPRSLRTTFSNHGYEKQPVRRTHTSPSAVDCKPHPPVTRASSTPVSDSRHNQSQLSIESSPWQSRCTARPYQSEWPKLAPGSPGRPPRSPRPNRPPPPYPGLKRGGATFSQQTESLDPQVPRSTESLPETSRAHSNTGTAQGIRAQDWQRAEKWQIWQLLSSDNGDTLPETLV